jgi:hypothetical protein
MPTPPIIFDPSFVPNVATGWGLTVLGGLLLLASAAWWSRAGDGARLEPKPAPWRALIAAGWLCFVLGVFWQLVGYYRIGAVTW